MKKNIDRKKFDNAKKAGKSGKKTGKLEIGEKMRKVPWEKREKAGKAGK